MRSTLLVLILVSSFLGAAQTNSYIQSHPENSEFAIEHLIKFKSEYSDLCTKYNCPADFVLSMVAPEIANYNQFQDELETQASEVFYVNLGDEYADFSLGMFQMKPSFVLELEDEVKSNEWLSSFNFITSFSDTSASKIRSERLDRIRDLEWRTAYLCCYYKILENKFESLNFETSQDKLKLFATAYNCGFRASLEDLNRWMKKPYFPNKGAQNDFVYADVSVEFYDLICQYD